MSEDFGLDTLIDIGANIGTICIPAVKRGIAKRAIAIEPEPRNYRLLVANIYLNDVADKIEHYNLALGSKTNQIVTFELSTDNSGDHRVRISSENGKFSEAARQRISVKSTKFDDLIQRLDKTSCLIWMDTQGYEGHILLGADSAVNGRVPMVLEFWPYGMKRADAYASLRTAVMNYDYYYNLSEDKPTPVATSTIDSLYCRLGENGNYTDILLT